jgi:uncharacterized Zn-binding protein involved in type VI secretion
MSARVTDINIGICNHGLPCCPHTITGMIITGSPQVIYDGLPAARFGDMTISSCPHCGGVGGFCIGSTPRNSIGGIPGHRKGDPVIEPFGMSITITGSPKCSDG